MVNGEIRTVLVTGGAGFIGSHVVDALVEAGVQVRVVDALLPVAHGSPPPYLNPRAEYIEADVSDADAMRAAVGGVDAVSHQAALVGLERGVRDAPAYVLHNDVGTAVLLRALADAGFAGRFVLASSMVIYGEGRYSCRSHGVVRPGFRTEERLSDRRFDPPCPSCGEDLVPTTIPEHAPAEPRSIYASSKLMQEHLVSIFGRERAAATTALRYHNVYGDRMPRDTPYAGVASIFRSALEGQRAPEVFEDGAQRRDFIEVRDVARANVLALLGPPAHGAFNIASGSPRTIWDLAETLCRAFGPGAPSPRPTGAVRSGDVRHVIASPERARRVLGFEARIPFEEGIRAFARATLREPAAAVDPTHPGR